MTCTNQTVWFLCTPHSVIPAWTHLHWEKLTFDQFISNVVFENCCLDNKRTSKVVETFRKFLEQGWGSKTFSDWSETRKTCSLAIIDTTVSFHGKGTTVQCCPTCDSLTVCVSNTSESMLGRPYLPNLVRLEGAT